MADTVQCTVHKLPVTNSREQKCSATNGFIGLMHVSKKTNLVKHGRPVVITLPLAFR